MKKIWIRTHHVTAERDLDTVIGSLARLKSRCIDKKDFFESLINRLERVEFVKNKERGRR